MLCSWFSWVSLLVLEGQGLRPGTWCWWNCFRKVTTSLHFEQMKVPFL
jgi:hypothetical protein